MIRYGEIARESYRSKHTKVPKACNIVAEDIPEDFYSFSVTVTLPDKTTDNQPIESLSDCTIVTLLAARNGSDPTDGIDSIEEIVHLSGAISVKLSTVIGRMLTPSDAGQSFTLRMSVLSLGKDQVIAAAAY